MGAPFSLEENEMATVKARVIRPVYVRGVEKHEGDVVDLSHQEFHEMRTTNFVVKHVEPEAPPVAAVAPAAPAVEPARADDKKGK